MPLIQTLATWGVPTLLLVASTGCESNDGPERFDLSGSVEFDGKPVPMGSIEFVPDSNAGNRGPAAYGEIVDGRYSTRAGKGIVGGPYLLTVTGYDGVATIDEDEGENPRGMPLFAAHELSAELPAEGRDFDIKIPASAGNTD